MQESIKLSVQGGIRSALQLVESRETLRKLYFSINEKPLPEALENEMLNNNMAINEVPVSRSGAIVTPNATQHNVPAWTIFAMFFIVMSLGGSIVREKNSGSFLRLKTLPTSYLVNIFSKQITYLAVTMLQAVVIFLMGIWLFPYFGLPALNLPSDIFALVRSNRHMRLVRGELCDMCRRIRANAGAGQRLWGSIHRYPRSYRRVDGAQLCHAGLFQVGGKYIAYALVLAGLLCPVP